MVRVYQMPYTSVGGRVKMGVSFSNSFLSYVVRTSSVSCYFCIRDIHMPPCVHMHVDVDVSTRLHHKCVSYWDCSQNV